MTTISSDAGFDPAVIRKSFQLPAPSGEALMDRFYPSLFENFPGVVPLFGQVNMDKQKKSMP